MEGVLRRIEAQLIEQNVAIRLLNSKVDSALQTLDSKLDSVHSKVDSALQDLATLSLKMESIVRRLPDGFRSDDGELATPSRNVRHRQRQPSLMELPVELQTEILVRMPVKSILLCKCVCKHFNNVIQSPNFIQTHLDRITPLSDNTQSLILGFGPCPDNPYFQWDHFLLSIDNTTRDIMSSLQLTPPIPAVNDEYHFVGSCNGLICVLVWHDPDSSPDYQNFFILLWNPVIKQCRYLPDSPCTGFPDAIEFGYVSETNDYLVIKLKAASRFFVEVYKMSIDSWIMIEFSLLSGAAFTAFRSQIYHEKTSVFLNGSFHWTFVWGDCINVLYYKTKDEKLEVMKGLDNDTALITNELGHHYSSCNQWELAVIDESLALIFWNRTCNKVEVWVMNEYGIEDSWTIRYQIVDDISSLLYPVGYWTNGSLLLLHDMEGLQLYDLHTRRQKEIPEMETNGSITTFCSFVETMVPVKYLG